MSIKDEFFLQVRPSCHTIECVDGREWRGATRLSTVGTCGEGEKGCNCHSQKKENMEKKLFSNEYLEIVMLKSCDQEGIGLCSSAGEEGKESKSEMQANG